MPKYEVTVTETRRCIYFVDADNEQDAVEITKDLFVTPVYEETIEHESKTKQL